MQVEECLAKTHTDFPLFADMEMSSSWHNHGNFFFILFMVVFTLYHVILEAFEN